MAYFRTLTSKYQTLLDQATKEIQKLSREKQSLEKEKQKLLATNVEMAKELTKISSKKIGERQRREYAALTRSLLPRLRNCTPKRKLSKKKMTCF